MPQTSHYWRFDNRPAEMIASDTFSLQTRELAQLKEGEILVKSHIISMDATNRLWLGEREELYMEPILLGQAMQGFSLCEVVESKSELYQPGQLVSTLSDWADYSILSANSVQPFDTHGLAMDQAFGVLSIAGPTAYHGLLNIGKPKPGETVVITAASGAVGSLTGQIAKLAGCRVVGTAGSDEKCAYLIEELGFDAAVNYRDDDIEQALKQACPDGIDIHFENVGGAILDHCLKLMNNQGRVVISGLISMYNSEANVPGPYMFHNTIMKRLKIEGFVILDEVQHFPAMQTQLAKWMHEGKLRLKLDINEGLESCPQALMTLYTSDNNGKVLSKLS